MSIYAILGLVFLGAVLLFVLAVIVLGWPREPVRKDRTFFSPVAQWMGRAFLRFFGWKLATGPPLHRKCVMIAAPHTTNWDLPFMLAVAAAADVPLRFMGKYQIFKIPIVGTWLKSAGGIPIVRHEKRNAVQQMVDYFKESDDMLLAVQPEGTRSRAQHWKSGFYRIALESQVPIVMGFLDYGRKRGGFGDSLMPTGNLKADMDVIRRFYADKTGKYPELFGPIQLENEEATGA